MSSYRDIFRSSGVIGAVQLVKIIFGLVQNKVLAVVVGKEGFGIWGMYNTYIELVSSFSTLGVDQSGVRQIARNPEDEQATGICIWVFRRTIITVSILASILSLVFSKQISYSLFRTPDYAWGVAIVSLVILFNGISKGNIAILNGLRHIRELALSQIIGAIIGAVAAISSVLAMGSAGIPLFLVAVGGTSAFTTWWYVRKLGVKECRPDKSTFNKELSTLVRLGLGFSVAGAVAALTAYLSRVYLLSEYGIGAVGIYQASWTISNLYIGTILTAMGIDFMPRLMRVCGDREAMNKMISEQLEFGVLVSSVGVLLILVFSPLVLNLFYSAEFIVGTPIIRWQVLGVAVRIFGFVLGYSIMAANRPVTFVITQSVQFVSDYLFLILFSRLWGFEALGINYFASYLLYLAVTYTLCRKSMGLHLGKNVFIITIAEWIAIGIVWIMAWNVTDALTMVAGTIFIVAYSLWCIYALKKYMNIDLMARLRKLLDRR